MSNASIKLSSGRVIVLELKDDLINTILPPAYMNDISTEDFTEIIWNLKGVTNYGRHINVQ